MSATATNGPARRKQLSDQLDRLDGIIDALADALPQAVAEAARAGRAGAVGQPAHGEPVPHLGDRREHVLGGLGPGQPAAGLDGLGAPQRQRRHERLGVLAPQVQRGEVHEGQGHRLGDAVGPSLGAGDAAEGERGVGTEPGQRLQEGEVDAIGGRRASHGGLRWRDRPGRGRSLAGAKGRPAGPGDGRGRPGRRNPVVTGRPAATPTVSPHCHVAAGFLAALVRRVASAGSASVCCPGFAAGPGHAGSRGVRAAIRGGPDWSN